MNDAYEFLKVLGDLLARMIQFSNIVGTGVKDNALRFVFENDAITIVIYLGNGGATKAAINSTKVFEFVLKIGPKSKGRTADEDSGSMSRGLFLILRFKGTNARFETIKIDTMIGIGRSRFSGLRVGSKCFANRHPHC